MPRFSAAFITHRGRVRDHNEDAAVVEHIRSTSGLYHLWAVADGMGGMARGEVASATALQTLVREMRARIDEGPRESLGAAFGQANSEVFALGQGSMGTTLTVALVHDASGATWVAHVGDSRAYLLAPGKFEQVTDDHSRVGEAQRSGKLNAEEAFTARGRNVLTRALGSDSEVKVEISGPRVLVPGESLLLCSDGVHGELRDADIEQTLRAGADGAGARLVRAALEAGGKDNITALVGASIALRAVLDTTRFVPFRARAGKPALPVIAAGSAAAAALVFGGLAFAFSRGGEDPAVTPAGATRTAEVQSAAGTPSGSGSGNGGLNAAGLVAAYTETAVAQATLGIQTQTPVNTNTPPPRAATTASATRTNTASPATTGTPSETLSPTATATSTLTVSATVTSVPSATPSKTSTNTPMPTPTPTPTLTPTPTSTTQNATPGATATLTPLPTRTSTPKPTNTPLPTATPTLTPTATATATATVTPESPETGQPE